jgi:dynamin GTPase
LELCREFEDKFLAHITSGEGSGWKIVASFEGKFPDRIKQLPLDRHFDLNNVKRVRSVSTFTLSSGGPLAT